MSSITIIIIGVVSIVIILGVTIISLIHYHYHKKQFQHSKNNTINSFDSNFPKSWFTNLINQSKTFYDSQLSEIQNTYWRIPGIYIIHNKNKDDKTYVGQSINLGRRIPQHFNNQEWANKRLWPDVVSGDKFTITIIPKLNNYPDLNRMEAGYIRLFRSDSYYGYNRSLGRNNFNKEMIKTKKGLKEYESK